ncbi:hypothetical protein N7492_008509 [Penicillium capsulatum]|uniref:Retrotransposon gag domain-containing protein n=1 Tax=Penicillium capsulatum TaxID=69766 RepID=A0A9W9HTL4_9EURO|nr:hypothetical protein N7492_008509 [Penicillium capsulatum]KAJ6105910.1 hypothetical protein N7512_009427 [Penicillium capsulatum]
MTTNIKSTIAVLNIDLSSQGTIQLYAYVRPSHYVAPTPTTKTTDDNKDNRRQQRQPTTTKTTDDNKDNRRQQRQPTTTKTTDDNKDNRRQQRQPTTTKTTDDNKDNRRQQRQPTTTKTTDDNKDNRRQQRQPTTTKTTDDNKDNRRQQRQPTTTKTTDDNKDNRRQQRQPTTTKTTDDNKGNRRQQRQPTTTKTTDDNKDNCDPDTNDPDTNDPDINDPDTNDPDINDPDIMTSKSNNDNPNARGAEDGEWRGRTRRDTVMAREATIVDDEGSDDDDYQPSNEDDRRSPPENTNTAPTIDAFDYLARLRHHFEFWWDVMVAMDKQAKMNTSQVTDQMIREQVIRLGEENRELRRERDRMTVQRDMAEKRAEELASKLDGAYRERDRDQSIIALMNTTRQAMPAPEGNNQDHVPRRDVSLTSQTEPIRRGASHSVYTTSTGRFDNPKFPDAPVFSGDRSTFDSWRDKVHDKLSNSAAQYPTEQQRIAYIRSRTDGIAYQQIRAQCQSNHPRSFQSADDVLEALEKIYGDKNKRKRAINELRTLRMGRKTFDDFYTDFARCAAEVGYAEDAMIPLLENAISNELARQVIGLQKPSDFYDLVDFYRDVDHEMRDYERRLPNRDMYRVQRIAPCSPSMAAATSAVSMDTGSTSAQIPR